MKRVTFVTGVSCAGKTAVHDALAPNTTVLDVDEGGTPPAGVGALNWLAYRNEQLLYQAANLSSDHDEPVVVTGILYPHKIIDSTAMMAIDPEVELRFILLLLSRKVLHARLKERLAGSGKPVSPFVTYNWGLQSLLRRQVEHQRHGIQIHATVPLDLVVSNVRHYATGAAA